jgi:hypothetical protein
MLDGLVFCFAFSLAALTFLYYSWLCDDFKQERLPGLGAFEE